MSARKTVVRTTSAKERPPALSTRPEVVEHAARLRRDVAVDDLAGRGIERHLSRDEQQLSGPHGLRVGTDGFRSVRTGNGAVFTHAALTTFLRAQAAGADPDTLNATVDHRPDRLQVGFEPPRAHVVRVAMLPADNRPLSTEFTSLRHIELSAFSYRLSARISIGNRLKADGRELEAGEDKPRL